MSEISYVVVEHLDPEAHVPGGIDSVIHGLLEYGPSGDVCMVGITNKADRTIGEWCQIDYAGRQVSFLPVARLDRSVSRARLIRVPHSMQFIFGIFRYRSRIPKTIHHAHRIETGLACLVLLRGQLVQFIHNDSTGLLGTNSDSSWKYVTRLYRWVERVVLKRAVATVLFNSTDASRVRKISARFISSRTWFDSKLFAPGSTSVPKCRSDGQIIVSWVGRFDLQKDPLLAIQVARVLRDSGSGVQLKMVGSGSLAPEMRRLIAETDLTKHVVFTGPLERRDVARVMADSDVMLMTSHYEGSPVVLAEANAMGTPVVATLGSDPDDAIVDGVNGFRVHTRNPRLLADAVVESLSLSRQACVESAQARSGEIAVRRLWMQLSTTLS